MKLSEFSGLTKTTVQLRNQDASEIDKNVWIIGEEINIISEGDYFYISQREKNNFVKVMPINAVESLHNKVSRGVTLWALTSIKKNRFYLRSIETINPPTSIKFDIGVAEKDVETLLSRGEINNDSIEAATTWLNEEFLLEGESQPRIFVSVYTASLAGVLELRGKEWVATLKEVNGYWSLSKLTRTKRSGTSLQLLQGDIKFIDSTIAAQLKDPSYKRALEEATGKQGSYIALWSQYSDMEWATKLEDARKLGSISFYGYETGTDSREWVFQVKKAASNAFQKKYLLLKLSDSSNKNDLTLEVMPKIPDWLDNNQDVDGSGLEAGGGRAWLCELISFKNDIITLRLNSERDRKPPYEISQKTNEEKFKKGIICLSMNGNKKSRQRRIEAVNSIQQQENPMLQLHYLLEGADVSDIKRRKIKPLSKASRELFKKGEPTPMQKKALSVALNTPDVAIIIGPPGTGKTQVITALQTRLAEELKDMPLQHQMLISSFQHDAVDNVLSKSNVFGLPAVKVGGKMKKNGDEGVDPISLWCENKATALNEILSEKIIKHPELNEVQKLQRKIAVLRVTQPVLKRRQEQVLEINISLELLANQYQIRPVVKLEQRWQQWTNAQLSDGSISTTLDNKQLIRHIRALRCTSAAFEDDGRFQCIRLLDFFIRDNYEISNSDLNLLEELSKLTNVNNHELNQLTELQTKLLNNALPDYRPIHVTRGLNEDECQLLDDLHDALEVGIKNSRTLGYIKVLDEYLSALKYSPKVIKKAAETYTSVLGATCQQAAGRPMMAVKDVEHQNSVSFNSVIVDEAARANPLDLLIPMSMAKQRIVLVGDHRQLPHLLEPKVEEQLAEKYELEQTHREMFNMSLFERLKLSLEKLEKLPGQSQRVVMLDTQFRMHPLLGDFVSEQFYQKHELAPVKSGLDASCFSHKVPGFEGKICGWVDIPEARGRSSRRNGSLQREAEADVIAKKAKHILSSCPSLSVGVITFYRAQVDTILESMLKTGLTEKVESGTKVSHEWQYTVKDDGEQIERLRVGTVDAFQGKEFDVVILSMVRTLPSKVDPEDEDSLNRAYGFLRLDNRLNVAMSRQHRLLIMVGDSKMATHPAAPVAAPSISAFYEFCKEPHGNVC